MRKVKWLKPSHLRGYKMPWVNGTVLFICDRIVLRTNKGKEKNKANNVTPKQTNKKNTETPKQRREKERERKKESRNSASILSSPCTPSNKTHESKSHNTTKPEKKERRKNTRRPGSGCGCGCSPHATCHMLHATCYTPHATSLLSSHQRQIKTHTGAQQHANKQQTTTNNNNNDCEQSMCMCICEHIISCAYISVYRPPVTCPLLPYRLLFVVCVCVCVPFFEWFPFIIFSFKFYPIIIIYSREWFIQGKETHTHTRQTGTKRGRRRERMDGERERERDRIESYVFPATNHRESDSGIDWLVWLGQETQQQQQQQYLFIATGGRMSRNKKEVIRCGWIEGIWLFRDCCWMEWNRLTLEHCYCDCDCDCYCHHLL